MDIDTIKELFKQYDYLPFAFDREEAASKEFNQQQDKEVLLEKWQDELFHELFLRLKDEKDYRLLNRMEKIAEERANKSYLDVMVKAVDCVRYDSPLIKMIVAETILGRGSMTARTGLVFLAYDLGEKREAKYLLDRAKALLIFDTESDNEKTRREDIMDKVKEVQEYLGIL